METQSIGWDAELVAEFAAELDEAHVDIEALLGRLTCSPADRGLLDDLFRRLHSIKSNLRMVNLDGISDFVHSLENVVDAIRRGALAFDNGINDVVLRCVDRVQGLSDATLKGQPYAGFDMDAARGALDRLGEATAPAAPLVAEVLRHVDARADASPVATADSDEADLDFFIRLAELAEARSPYWVGRAERLNRLALDMNTAAGGPVDAAQLSAAAYLHDLGMSFLSLDLLHKADSLDSAERQKMELHPELAAGLLSRMDGWTDAARMVAEHHEWFDGSGYPLGLAKDDICNGARILAVADAFESVTHERADRAGKQELLQAVAEINRCAGSQFDPAWVSAFNDVIRSQRVSRG